MPHVRNKCLCLTDDTSLRGERALLLFSVSLIMHPRLLHIYLVQLVFLASRQTKGGGKQNAEDHDE